MLIETNQGLIEAYSIAKGPTSYLPRVRREILRNDTNIPHHYTETGSIMDLDLNLGSGVLGYLEQLISGKIDPEQARRERHNDQDEQLRTAGKIGLSRKNRSGRVAPSTDHKG
jgi:hypothetical protein